MIIRPGAIVISALGILAGLLMADWRAALAVNVLALLLALVDAGLAPRPIDLAVARESEATTRLGQTVVAKLTLTNLSRRPLRGEIRDAWPPSAGVEPSRHKVNLNAGERRVVRAAMTPTRRGTRKSEAVTIRTFGPMRIGGRQKTFDTLWDLRVLPPFHAKRHLPSRLTRLRELEGRALLLVRGQGTEFDSLREYVAGDDVRAIDWRSTARRGETVVRTWRPERDRRVVIVVDSGRSGAQRVDDAPAFDSYIETALLMSALATKAGDRVDVIVIDNEVQARVAGEQGAGLMNKVANKLADVEPSLSATAWPLAITEVAGVTTRPALVILLTAVGSGTVASGLLDVIPTLARTHTVLVASAHSALGEVTAETQTMDSVYEAAAFARGELETEAISSEMRRLGATIVRADPEGLPPKVADTYLELKARGKL